METNNVEESETGKKPSGVKIFFKKPIVIISIVVCLGVVFSGYFFLFREGSPEFKFDVVEKSTLIQEVSVTGRVEPAESVDLAFEKSGKVAGAYVEVGDDVRVGQTLVFLGASELLAQRLQAESNLEAEQAKLSELEGGTRPEEIQSAQTNVLSAEISLSNDQENLINVGNKADADLRSDYDGALVAAQKSVSVGKIALLTLTDIQFAHFVSGDQESAALADAKAAAVLALFGITGSGSWGTEEISSLEGGVFGLARNSSGEKNYEQIDSIVIDTLVSLREIKNALDMVPVTIDLTATEKTNLSAEKTSIDTEITTISGASQNIAVQKATNASNISAAEAKINTAENALASVRDALTLKEAGATPEAILAQKAVVKSKEASVASIKAQLSKTVIRSPLNGIVTRQDAKVGEIVAANTNIVSLISGAKFEIESNVTEADIARIAVENTGKVTLDAYGNDMVFDVVVVSIDPSETIIEGVATYKTTLQFQEDNDLIRPGMTANIDILSATKDDVLAISQRLVIRRNGTKTVKVLRGEEVVEVEVETGIRDSFGNIEIISGLEEGDMVITSS